MGTRSGHLDQRHAPLSRPFSPLIRAPLEQFRPAQVDARMTRRARGLPSDCVLSPFARATLSMDSDSADDDGEAGTQDAPCSSPDAPPWELRRLKAAREYLSATGDLHSLVASNDLGANLAKAVAKYIHILDKAPKLGAGAGGPVERLYALTPEQLWAKIPLSEDTRPLPPDEDSLFHNNPAVNVWCSDPTPLVGPRQGGTDLPQPLQHNGRSVDVDFLGLEAESALYGQYASREALMGSLRCNLEVALPVDGQRSASLTVSCVADSGATCTAIRVDRVNRLVKINKMSKCMIERTSKRFTGISGDVLNCLGWICLHVKIASRWVTTRAFVFQDMHEPMLLGVNTLSAYGLSVDTRCMGLYPSPQSSLPPGATPLFTRSYPARDDEASPAKTEAYLDTDRLTMYICRDDTVCGTVPCAPARRRRNRRRPVPTGGGKIRDGASPECTDVEASDDSDIGLDRDSQALPLRSAPSSDPDERARLLNSIEALRAAGALPRETNHLSTLVVMADVTIDPGDTEAVHLYIQDDILGPNRELQVRPSPEFEATFPELNRDINPTVEFVFLHQSAYRLGQYRFRNYSEQPVVIRAGTVFGSATGSRGADMHSFQFQHHPDYALALLDDPTHEILLDEPAAESPEDPDDEEIPRGHVHKEPPPGSTALADFEGLGPTTINLEYSKDVDYETREFSRGGKPRTRADLETLGLDFLASVEMSASLHLRN